MVDNIVSVFFPYKDSRYALSTMKRSHKNTYDALVQDIHGAKKASPPP